MSSMKSRSERRTRRKRGIRKGIFGVPSKPRLSVFRSSKHIYAQVIDDLTGRTLVSASTNEKESDSAIGGNATGAKEVGSRLAERATGAGVTAVVFDRNGYRYHGRVRALADAAREGGLKF
ncbi:MAG: 50S ribosomal protein L18 [Phycisphaerales bacterium]|nr:50S ribosomal protein L18 [Phycisphaerales bacterium]